jgi:integrase
MPGLRFRHGVWHIEKQIKGYGSLYETCGTGNLEEAERVLTKRLEEIRQQVFYGVRPSRNFRQAAIKYLEEATHKSVARDAQSLKIMEPHLGDLPIEKIHMGNLQGYINLRRAKGCRSGTVRRELSVVRRIVILAARRWRDEDDRPWLDTPPLIDMPDWEDGREPYPLSWQEQSRLLATLPEHLRVMALFKVNTGTREQEVCSLRWEWEVDVPELKASVFIIPGKAVAPDWTGTKNKEDRVVVLNRSARIAVESQRGKHDKYVFTFRGNRLGGMKNNGWRKAWQDAGLPMRDDCRRGPHNLKHTCGRRLRAAGVTLETRKVLLGHKSGDITTHYSVPEIKELLDGMELIAEQESGKSPALTLLRRNEGVIST